MNAKKMVFTNKRTESPRMGDDPAEQARVLRKLQHLASARTQLKPRRTTEEVVELTRRQQ